MMTSNLHPLIDRTDAVKVFCHMMEGNITKILLVTGDPKMGKSRLLKEYSHIAKDQFQSKFAIVDLRIKVNSVDGILYQITQQLGTQYFPFLAKAKDEISNSDPINFNNIFQFKSRISLESKSQEKAAEYQRQKLTDAFIKDLKELAVDFKYLLIFDAFEQSDDIINSWIYNQLIMGLHNVNNIYIIVAGRELPQANVVWSDTSDSFNLLPVDLDDFIKHCKENNIMLSEGDLKWLHVGIKGVPGEFVELLPTVEEMINES